jgi:glycosyltransferase involved in cell wall biosynthesis
LSTSNYGVKILHEIERNINNGILIMKKISVIIPVYNEEKNIESCLFSVIKQTYKNIEIIVVNDGSTDNTQNILKKFRENIKIISSTHQGPGASKNIGVSRCKGEILVFIDADMQLDKEYISNIIKPIKNNTITTFHINEFVINFDNIWSKCWNINNSLPIRDRISKDNILDNKVVRAIKKDYFQSIGGFDISKGYSDDKTLTGKDIIIVPVEKAVCYHTNPDNLIEIFYQARWIGMSEEFPLSIYNLYRYSIMNSIIISVNKILMGIPISFMLFKIIFDFGIVVGMFNKNRDNNYAK